MADYSKLLTKKVDYVFAKLVSLLTEVTFVLREGESYNFGTAQKEIGSQENLTTKVLVVKTTQGLNAARKQLLLKDIKTLDIYDHVLIGMEKWVLGAVTYDDGYTKIVEVVNGQV